MAVEFFGGTISVYANGVQLQNATFGLPVLTAIRTSNFIGKDNAGNGDLQGYIDEFRVYYKALSSN